MSLAGMSPAGALIVRAGEPRVLHVFIKDREGNIQNLTGRTLSLIVRRTSERQPLFTIGAELSGDASYFVISIAADMASGIVDAGTSRSLSYDLVETSGGGSVTRWTERVAVTEGPELPDLTPVTVDLPATQAIIEPDAIVISERGATGNAAATQLFLAGLINAPTIEAMNAFYAAIATQAAQIVTDQLAARVTSLDGKQRGGKMLMALRTGGAVGFGFDVGYRPLQFPDLPKARFGLRDRSLGDALDDGPRSLRWHRSKTRPNDGCVALESALDFRRAAGSGRRWVSFDDWGWLFDAYPDPARLGGALIECNGIAPGAPPTVFAVDPTRPILYLDASSSGLRMRGAFHAVYRSRPAGTLVRAIHIRDGAHDIYIDTIILTNATAALYLGDCSRIRIGRVIALDADAKIIATSGAQDVRIGEWIGPGTVSVSGGGDVQIGAVLSGLLPGLAGLSPVANKAIRYDASGVPVLMDWLLDQPFTPEITCSDGTIVTLSPGATQTGTYSKRGKRVTVSWLVSGVINFTGAGAGDLRMSLPVAADSNTTTNGLPMTRLSAFTWPGTATMLSAQPSFGQSYARIMGSKSGGTWQATQLSAFPSGSSITLGFRGDYDAAS